ncbi:AAA family ATPase [Thioalkalivibrio sp. ALJ16]|uniref:AAA family ATPase n=1 Tax=Thioalkalivibrio sp. ALJ16 TaxID=1158762 RepID=UPI0003651EA7|nr:AAA family ATPase [Thioalkalivibrio sp. ALJ16]
MTGNPIATAIERAPEACPVETEPTLHPVSLGDFLSMQFPPRENLLSPWLPRQGLAMLFAPRGVGKTFVALHVAYAVASGGSLFGRWHAPAPATVVYLDGEMPAAAMQERLAGIVAASDAEASPGAFHLLTPDLHRDGMPNLASQEGQAAVDAALPDDTSLIVVDNLSTLAHGGKENEAESWLPVQTWALRHRAAGRSVLFVHHAGKGGAQRGTSRREDVLDTVINLRRPAEYTPDQGAAFEIHFEKARGIHGEDVEPFEARLELRAGRLEWTCRSVEDSTRQRVLALHEDGLRPVEIATELECNRSTVSRHLRALGVTPNKGGAR